MLVPQVIDISALPELRVNPTFSPELQALAEQMTNLNSQAEVIHRRMSSAYPELRLEKHSMYGLVLRSPQANQESVYKSASDLNILCILKNGVYMTTKALQRLSDQMAEAQQAYTELSADIIEKGLETSLTYVNLIDSVAQLVAEVDVLAAFAAVSACCSYVRPVMREMGSAVMEIVGARHPCVEALGDAFIPNSYSFAQSRNFHIITGPNMGGKSTYIRALGCIAVLAQVGCFVPAASAEITCVDAILARVGAGDQQQKGVSTFMAEMLESSVILQTATAKSLVIIDELGRGTSTFDGYGLAFAISHHLATRTRCFAVFATHFHEVTALEHEASGVVNHHVTAQIVDGKVVMLYRVAPGVCWESYGVPVARMAKFPASVLAQAQRKLDALERSLEDDTAQPEGKRLRREEAAEQALSSSSLAPGLDYSMDAQQLKQKLQAWLDQYPNLVAV